MRSRRSLAALFVLCLALCAILLSAPASAATIQVPSAGAPTIQAGINAANNGDTVLVSPGTYYENIDFKGKAITVTSSGGAAVTIIDGSGSGPAVTFKTAETRSAILSNFTIQHGGSFESFSGSQLIFETPGVAIDQSSPTILNNVITLNDCWGIRSDLSGPLIQGNEISATQDPHGQCSFGGGSGIYIGGNLNGGSPVSSAGTPATIIGNTIENNVESGIEDAGGNGGAAIAVWGGSPLIENNILRNNASPGGSGGAINIESGTNISIIQNLIYGNSAGCGGGAIAFEPYPVSGAPDLLIANNTIVNNTGLGTYNASECTNISQLYPEPDAYGSSGSSTVIVNNIISGSTSYPSINCDWFGPPSEWTQPIFDHNILYNPGGAFFGNFCIDVSQKYGNITADPRFVNAAANNFHLTANSPAIDSGNNSSLALTQQLSGVNLQQDFEGNTRVQDATAKGYPVIDMGAYEFAGAVDASPTTVVVTPSAYGGSAGNTYTLTATLSSPLGIPTGSAEFYLDGNPIGSSVIGSAGIAIISNFQLAPGIHNVYASYAGQGSFPPAISVIVLLNIDRYSTTLTLSGSPNPSLVNQPVTFTVHASSADQSYIPFPITLVDQSTSTALAFLVPNSSGIASYTTSTLSVGSHLIVASYIADAQHAGQTALWSQQVVPGYTTTTSLVSSQNPAPYGQTVTFTATVSNIWSVPGTPTGSITFTDGSTVLGTQALSASGTNSATATFSISTLSVGSHPIVATYVPTGVFAASSGGLQQTITGLSTSTTLNSSLTPASVGQPVTFTATVANNSTTPGAPNGSVTFSDGATVLGSQPLTASGASSATATWNTSTLAAGTHTIIATYVPSGGFSASSGQLVETVNALASATALAAAPNPAFVGSAVAVTATATGSSTTPTGTITFYDGTTSIGAASLNASGQANLTTTSLAVGTHMLTAVYSGSSTYAASTSMPFSEVIQPLPQDFTITLAPPSISIKAQHHTTTSLTLASINGFADSLAISCANLPQYVTCQPTPSSSSLSASGTAAVSLYLDTDSVLGYAHLTPPKASSPASLKDRSAPISLALLLSPLSLLALSRRRRASLRLLMLLLALLPISLALSGCGEIILPYSVPPFAAPGTYTIPITATGITTHISHTANLTLTITP